MFGYRVTKYDPSKRDRDGKFLGEDWTSISDIGRTIGGTIFSKSDYLRSEDAYVETVKALLSAANISSMRVTDLEIRASGQVMHINDDVLNSCQRLQNNKIVSGNDFENVVRGCLREYIWCRMSGQYESYVHFGYDYYMYVGLPKPAKMFPLPHGIFFEELESPYMTTEE